MPDFVEYRLRPVTRYIVSRYERGEDGDAASMGRGEYDNADTAFEVGYALCKAEHERLGWPAFDERIRYPAHPNLEACVIEGEDVTSSEFAVPVENVLHGARDLVELAVVGIDADGALQVFSSCGTPQTMAMLDRARPHIEELRQAA